MNDATPNPPPSPRRSVSDAPGFRLGRAFGVELFVDWSLLIIFTLITLHLGAGVLPDWHPEWSLLAIWTTAVGAAVLFFASILAHELSHAIVGRWQGVGVRRITLFLFGGAAEMEGEPKSPRAELLMAGVGPLVSLVIGVGATLLGAWLAAPTVDVFEADPATALSALGVVSTLLLWLGPVNVLLAVFNLVPGFPLDGGRVARSILWWITGDLVRATRLASLGGRAFAWFLMGFGLISVFRGAFVGGLWLLLIGWFLNNAARASYQQLLASRALHDVPVKRLMFRGAKTIDPTLPLEAFVQEFLLVSDQTAYPVVHDESLVGMVTLEDVRRVPQERWAQTLVCDVMTGLEALSTVAPETAAEEALQQLDQRDVGQLPGVVGGRVVGVVRRRDLVKWVALQHTTPRAA